MSLLIRVHNYFRTITCGGMGFPILSFGNPRTTQHCSLKLRSVFWQPTNSSALLVEVKVCLCLCSGLYVLSTLYDLDFWQPTNSSALLIEVKVCLCLCAPRHRWPASMYCVYCMCMCVCVCVCVCVSVCMCLCETRACTHTNTHTHTNTYLGAWGCFEPRANVLDT